MKNKIQKIVLHTIPCNSPKLHNQIKSLHIEIIHQRLNDSGLTTKQKIAVLDMLIKNIFKT